MHYHLFMRDVAEIACYSFIIYTFCIWLKTDKTKSLLSYFLAYCSITIFSWAIEFPTLVPFLLSYAPIALILFIILHEKTLQRNLVSLRTITPPAQPHQEDWLDTLLSSALTCINNNSSITIVIENNDSLEHFLDTPFFIDAHLGKGILSILLSSSSYDEKKIVWVNTHGQIRGINATWHTETQQLQPSLSHLIFDKQNALFYSLQCDALIVHINQFTRSFTLIFHGNEIQKITAHEIKNMIKKQLTSPTVLNTKGFSRESTSTQKPSAK